MIETNTTWEDSGYDCDHCGGQIYERTDTETNRSPKKCLQCRRCGCQWTTKGDVKRVGHLPECVRAQRERQQTSDPSTEWDTVWTRRILIGLGFVAIFFVIRLGGVLALRYLLPVIFGAFIIWSIVNWIRRRQDF